jgi:hypothetical protein
MRMRNNDLCRIKLVVKVVVGPVPSGRDISGSRDGCGKDAGVCFVIQPVTSGETPGTSGDWLLRFTARRTNFWERSGSSPRSINY